MESSRSVWSSKEGYPGDYNYREYYRDIGFDLDMAYIGPYVQPNGHRKMTGVKYYRITGGPGDKEIYSPDEAAERVAAHAADFLNSRIGQTEKLAELMDRPPLIMVPYDAELFGHWWHEGPQFLETLFRNLSHNQNTIEPVTPSEYLQKYPRNQVVEPSASSWGQWGYADVWLNERNDWIYPHLHKAADRMVELAQKFPAAGGVTRRALNQAARELMLAQSSDWAFILKSGTMTHYAENRVKEHLVRFNRLYDDLTRGSVDEPGLRDMESKDNLFNDLDYRVYVG